MQLLALSGSLRVPSYNTDVLRALKYLTAERCQVSVFEFMGNLPLFNPNTSVSDNLYTQELALRLQHCDGLVIVSPEYAHGISGVLKNALDWLVAVEAFYDKPIMIINCSPRAHHAVDQLNEVLTTMSGRIIFESYAQLPLLGSGLDFTGMVESEEISTLLLSKYTLFEQSICLTQKQPI